MANGTKQVQRIELTSPIDVILPDGNVVRVRPGSYNKGISIAPVLPRDGRPAGQRGRKPRESTIRLRERLARDHAGNGLRAPRDYVTWLCKLDDGLSVSGARQVVYRERRAILDEQDATA